MFLYREIRIYSFLDFLLPQDYVSYPELRTAQLVLKERDYVPSSKIYDFIHKIRFSYLGAKESRLTLAFTVSLRNIGQVYICVQLSGNLYNRYTSFPGYYPTRVPSPSESAFQAITPRHSLCTVADRSHCSLVL